jgi:DNA repair protein SbcC/Rad50
MISKLILHNFQCHPYLCVEFDKGVTTLVGKSDIGKSAILRALQWVATNKPSGSAFISHGSDSTKVSVLIDDQVLKRKKGKGGNKYQINTKDLVAFNQDVPEEVALLFNVDPELNFQNQHTGPFWFNTSAGEVSRNLNQIINLGAIDRVLAKLNQSLRENSALIELCSVRLLTAKSKRAELLEVEDLDSTLKMVEQKELGLGELRTASTLMHNLIQGVVQGRLVRKRALGLEYEGKLVLEKGVAWERTREQRDKLRSLMQQVVARGKEKAECDNKAIELQGKWDREAKGKICPICNQILK